MNNLSENYLRKLNFYNIRYKLFCIMLRPINRCSRVHDMHYKKNENGFGIMHVNIVFVIGQIQTVLILYHLKSIVKCK